MEKCLNCGNEVTGNYCSYCGQRKADAKLTLQEIFSDFIQAVFLFDRTLYRTLVDMLYRPGRLIRSYLGGKKKTYLPPFQYFLLFMTIYLLILNYFGDDIFQYLRNGPPAGSDALNRLHNVQAMIKKNLNILNFLMTPIFAFYVWIFHRKYKINYPESMILSVYVTGTGFFLSILSILLSLIETRFFMSRLLILFAYDSFCLISFTRAKFLPGLIRSGLTVICSYLTFIILISILVTLYLVLTR